MAILSRIRGFFNPTVKPSFQKRLAESEQFLKVYDAGRRALATKAGGGVDTRQMNKNVQELGRQWLRANPHFDKSTRGVDHWSIRNRLFEK